MCLIKRRSVMALVRTNLAMLPALHFRLYKVDLIKVAEPSVDGQKSNKQVLAFLS